MATRRQLLIGGLVALGASAGCSSRPAVAGNGRPPKDFGVAIDPWTVGDWAKEVGARPTTVMEFESWDRNRTLDTHFQAARDAGLRSYVITWEPWKPVDASLGQKGEFELQPAFSNQTIADGKLDDYVTRFAKSVKKAGLTVYLRWGHEMTGRYYPWGHDPDAYIRAWRRIVDTFRSVGATNAKFIFAPGENLFDHDDDRWMRQVQEFWPGPEHVDLVGTTMINLGGQKTYQVKEFYPRLMMMHDKWGKDVYLAEVNSALDGRVEFFTDLRTWLATPQADLVHGIVLSQLPSRGQAVLGDVIGDLQWQVTDDSETKPVIKALINDIT